MPRSVFARIASSRHLLPVAFIVALAFGYWARVLITGQILLPGEFLRGFAPFGSDGQAPWNILQWDALGQYYPWRVFAARELQSGLIPLWNQHQFSGAPFVANGQSAVFYPLNLAFWLFDVAWTFGFSAFLHTLLAALGTYALLQRWNLSRAASVLGAVAFAFCGYLAAWVMLPTLANTASWLPLCVLLLEQAAQAESEKSDDCSRLWLPRISWLSLALACALLAGHAQIFFYILVALAIRALFLPRIWRALSTLVGACTLCVFIGAIQILPTLELARLGHRAGGSATLEGWKFLGPRALQLSDLLSLILPLPPTVSFSENFGYVGVGVFALVAIAILSLWLHRRPLCFKPSLFALTLSTFGLLYATATPLAKVFYFTVPGLSQMGGVGRALILWSFGAALLAALGLDALRRRWPTPVIPVVAILILCGELVAAGLTFHRTAPREIIYPQTEVTSFLQSKTSDGARVLLLTPRNTWLPPEVLQQTGRNHPPGVLPPNGAIVYGLYDVAGYDSLAPRAYREFLSGGEGADVSPPLNGNMILLENIDAPTLDALGVRYVVSQSTLDAPNLTQVLSVKDAVVYERRLKDVPRRDGRDFSPGWSEGKYQPQSFRVGAFLSLLAIAFLSAVFAAGHRRATIHDSSVQ